MNQKSEYINIKDINPLVGEAAVKELNTKRSKITEYLLKKLAIMLHTRWHVASLKNVIELQHDVAILKEELRIAKEQHLTLQRKALVDFLLTEGVKCLRESDQHQDLLIDVEGEFMSILGQVVMEARQDMSEILAEAQKRMDTIIERKSNQKTGDIRESICQYLMSIKKPATLSIIVKRLKYNKSSIKWQLSELLSTKEVLRIQRGVYMWNPNQRNINHV